MTLALGRDEQLVCIQDTTAHGPKGEKLCLAYKLTRYCVGASAYMTNDGYVLKIDGQSSYYPLDEATTKELQGSGALPTPLPPYSIPASEYVAGYLLWIALAVGVLIEVARRRLRRAPDKPKPA